MVSIFTGTGAGLERGSGALLGGAGVVGSGALGRSGEQVSVNAANGNLVIAQRDEFLAGRGPDAVIARTYNSLGNQSDDNGDNWRQSTDRRIKDKTSTTVVRVSGDGSETTFTWNGSAYVTTEGAGAYDRLTLSGDTWTFTDGDTQATETYEANGSTGTWRLRDEKDSNGVTLSYQYQGSKLWRVATSAGEYVEYGWQGDNIDRVVTGYVDATGNKTLTRTRYGYDVQNRLQSVTVDLSPDDNSVTDGKTYRTDYTYYDSTKRVKTITQTDGTSVEFEYDPSNRIKLIRQTLTGSNGQPTTRLTALRYEAGATADRSVTVITDPLLQETRLEYDTVTGRLMKVTAPKPDAATPAQVVSFGYNANGDVTSVTDATGATTSYTYTATGLVDTETSATNEVIRRSYDSGNRLLSLTRSGSDASSDKAEHTTRYTYDAKGNLRFSIDAEGGVTEYRYDGFGQQIGRMVFTDSKYSAANFALNDLVGWAAARDAGKAEVTAMTYDVRGNPTSTVTGATLTDTLVSMAIAERVNTSVSLQPNGLYRVQKTGGTADWNADARSTEGLSGDFVVNIRPKQANLLMMAGVSSDPTTNSSWTSLGFAFYMNENGQLYATENGQSNISLNASYAAGDNLWLVRSGSVIRYYKGATYAEALDVGPLRTSYGGTGTLFFDSSTLNVSAAFDVGLYRGSPAPVSTPIANGVNVDVSRLTNGGYRLTKAGGVNAAWDADARGSRAFAGDFALSVRPVAGDKILMAGLSRNPGGSSSYPNQVWQDLAYSFYFQTDGNLYAMETGNSPSLGSYAAGEQFWITRSGTTLTYYRGDISAPGGATVLRTVQNVSGTLYFDSALYQTGSQVDVAMASTSAVPDSVPLVTGNNTVVTAQADGLWRMTKTGSAEFNWNADARSQSSITGNFILQVRPNQSNRFMMVGVTTNSTNSPSGKWDDLDYGVYFQDNGSVFAWEGRGNSYGLGSVTTYSASDTFWIARVGSTISYYRGADFASASAAGALRTVSGVTTGAVWLDSSIAQTGASADVAFTATKPSYSPVYIASGTNMGGYPISNMTSFVLMKLDGKDATWDADSLSTRALAGDFALRVQPSAANKFMMLGISRNPTSSASYTSLDYAFYFQNDGTVFAHEGGGASTNGLGTYTAGQDFWLIREGTTLYYCRGSDAASARQNVLRTIGGASGSFYFDCSFYQLWTNAEASFLEVGITPATRAVPNMITGIDAANGGSDSSSGGSRTTYVYNTAGQLLSRKTDMLGAESFAYDGLGRVVQSSDANGGSTIITFNDAAGNAATTSTVALVNGLVTTSTYNRAGELISSVRAGQNATLGDASGTATNTYDKLGRLRATFDASGRARFFLYDAAGRRTAEIGHTGEVAEYRYDAANRIVGTIRYGLRISGTPLARAMAENDGITIDDLRPALNGNEIRSWRVYDKLGRLVETIDGDGGVTGYAYDASDRLIRTTSYVNKLATGPLITTPPTTTIWPASNAGDTVSRTFYDKDGRLLGSLDGEGYLTTVDYDAAGRKVATTSYAAATSTQNNLRSQGTLAALKAGLASATDRTSRWVYDRLGLLRFEIDPIGRVVEYVYDSGASFSQTGQVRQTIRYAGSISQLGNYDMATVRAALTPLAGNADNRRSFAVYDAAGRVAYAIDASGSVTNFTYDSSGRVTKSIRFAQTRMTTTLPTLAEMDGWRSGNASSGDNRTTWNYYNARGELRYTAEATGLIDAEGAYLTGFTYDAEGRLTETRRYGTPIALSTANTDIIAVDNSTRTPGFDAGRATRTVYDLLGNVFDTYDGEGIRTHYDYNATGTLIYKTVAFGSPDAAVTRYTYDGAGRVRETFAADGTPEQQRTAVEYDGLGNVVRMVDAGGNAATRAYDRAGRLLTETDALLQTVEYSYDAFDQLIRTKDARGSLTYNFYDRAGRLSVTRDAENYLTETSYTNFGEVESVTRRYNKSSNSGADQPTVIVDAVRDATTRFRYDRLGRVIETTDAENNVEKYELNAFGQRRQVTGKAIDGVSLVTRYGYDRRGLVSNQTVDIPAANGRPAESISTAYGYDARGNLTKLTEAAGRSEERVTEYVYDKNDRLKRTDRFVAISANEAENRSVSEQLEYDDRGNVAKRTDANGRASFSYYDKLGRVVATVDASGAVVRSSYQVLTDGRSVRTDRAYATRVDNPQALSTRGSGPTPPENGLDRRTETRYDRLGRVAAVVTLGYYGGRWVNGSYVVSGSDPTRSFTYDAGGNVTSTTEADGGVSYAYYDRLGRQSASIDALGYLTTWTRDREGNVSTEVRYANAVGGAPSVDFQPSATADPVNDRTTLFTYDRLGQRLSEARQNVEYVVTNTQGDPVQQNDAKGTPVRSSGESKISYRYNALGQVTQKKIIASGEGNQTAYDVFDYVYDAAGRLIIEKRPGFASVSAGGTATPTLEYSYDGLGNLTRTRQGNAIASAATDRITTYKYGVGGRLIETNDATAVTDATGARRTYRYDDAGQKIAELYARRLDTDNNWANEALLYSYDATGRLESSQVATQTNTAGVFTKGGDVTKFSYNAFGEVEWRALNDQVQERSFYDSAGRLFSSTAGDGVQRYYLTDARGNRTLAIEAAGDQNIFGYPTGKAAYEALALSANDKIAVTTMAYDLRGQLTGTVQRWRQIDASSARHDLTATRSYNAFGETTRETDALNATTTYVFNSMGRVTQITRPAVPVTDASGVTTPLNPVELFGYDRAGRLLTTTDANGYTTRRRLLAGSGHNGGEALVVTEWRPDNFKIRFDYDHFGDLRSRLETSWQEGPTDLRRETNMRYDALGRLIWTKNARGLIDQYDYDALGQRIRHHNSVLSANNAELTRYDAQGRVTSVRAFGGATTTTEYSWNTALETRGLGLAAGGVEKKTTYANGRTSIERSDSFGHVLSSVNMGGGETITSFDFGGRIVRRIGAEDLRYTYFNTALAATATRTDATGASSTVTVATYGYDKAGRKAAETTSVGGVQYQNAEASYDAGGRMVSWIDRYQDDSQRAKQTWLYDAVGNIRKTRSEYQDQSGTSQDKTAWYAYDEMNRVVIDGGSLVNGQIVRGDGKAIAYDGGNRAMVTSNFNGTLNAFNETTDTYSQTYYSNATRTEYYGYNLDGSLSYASNYFTDSSGNYIDLQNGAWSRFHTDDMGRVTQQLDYDRDENRVFQRDVVFGQDGVTIASDTVISSRRSSSGSLDTFVTDSTYYYDGTQGFGQPTLVTQSTKVNGGTATSSSTSSAYNWYDGPVVATTTASGPGGSSTTRYTYTGSGALAGVVVNESNLSLRRTVSIVNDVLGQAIERSETGHAASTPERWYRFDGRQIGAVGISGTDTSDFYNSTEQRTASDGSSRVGTVSDWNGSYEGYNSYSQGSQQGTYTVRSGDTLASIAASLWGDAGLWYKIAEANGITRSDAALTAGALLQIPANVVRTTNSASTFRSYDPSDAYGDTSPTTPNPQAAAKKNKCGVFGQILLVAIAIAVVAVTAGSAIAAAAPLATASYGGGIVGALGALGAGATTLSAGALIGIGAGAAALGSIVSQGFGVATGIQNQFSWKAVALAGIAGGISAGLGPGGIFGQAGAFGSSVGGVAASAALGSTITQGIGVATRLQSKFDFVGVVAAAASAGVGARVGRGIGSANTSLVGRVSVNTASGIANAALRTVVSGGSFGDNLLAALPDIVGQTVGDLMRGSITGVLPKRAQVAAGVSGSAARAAPSAAPTSDGNGPSSRPAPISELSLKLPAIKFAPIDVQLPSLSAYAATSQSGGSSPSPLESGAGPDYLQYRERRPNDLLTVQVDRIELERYNNSYQRSHGGLNYANYQDLSDRIDQWDAYYSSMPIRPTIGGDDLTLGISSMLGAEFTKIDMGVATMAGSFRSQEAAMHAGVQFATSGPTFAQQQQAREAAIERSIWTGPGPLSPGGVAALRAMNKGVRPSDALATQQLVDNVNDLVMAAYAVPSGARGGYRPLGALTETSLSLSRPSIAATGAPLDALETWGVRPAPGTRVIPEGIPEGWRIRPTREPGGVWYYDPANPAKGDAVRVMQGQPNSPFPNSQAPYVRSLRNGQSLDVNGNVVPRRSPDAHIPLPQFKFNPEVYKK